MIIRILATPELLGAEAARAAAAAINEAIADRGEARIAVSTGASQFETLAALTRENVDWPLVTMFHLDEYVGLPETHPASFRKYLKERFVSLLPLKRAFFVDGEGELQGKIALLNREIEAAPIDLGLIGIGENGHIAFNDPPARFEAMEPYRVVDLEDACKRQQVREGWFGSLAEVPSQAVSMSCHRIMMCRKIISCVPHAEKAEAIRKTFEFGISDMVPASLLKFHPDWTLFLDEASARGLGEAVRDFDSSSPRA
jgi:glucosamine-6-phosphate deaminase